MTRHPTRSLPSRARRWLGVAAAAAMLGACSSSGGEDQTEDLFLDRVEAACRASSLEIDKLEAGDEDAPGDLSNLLNDAFDELHSLEPPESIAGDYNDFTSTIDDETTTLAQLVRAVRSGDDEATTVAVDELNQLSAKADGQARGMSILKCVGLTPENGLVVIDQPTDTTTGSTTESSTATTTETTDTTDTTAGSTPIYPVDLSIDTPPPDGYNWVTLDPVDVSGLYDTENVGPLVTFYGGGRVENIADGSTASIYVLSISEDWTPDAIAEYEFWEGVEGGTHTTTPNGVPVTQKFGAFPDTDCVVFTGGRSAITVCTFTGVDGLSLLDKFVAAQPAD